MKLYQLILLLFISYDCDWNQIWIERYIDQFVVGNVKGEGLWPFSIKRFFNPKDGYCPEEVRIAFIQKMKEKYSEEIQYNFGFRDF